MKYILTAALSVFFMWVLVKMGVVNQVLIAIIPIAVVAGFVWPAFDVDSKTLVVGALVLSVIGYFTYSNTGWLGLFGLCMLVGGVAAIARLLSRYILSYFSSYEEA